MLPRLERQPAWAVWAAGAALAALLTLAAYAWVLVPQRDRDAAASEVVAQVDQHRAEAQTLQGQLDDLTLQLEQTRSALAEQPLALGDPRRLNRQIAALIALARDQGLEVIQLQPGELQPGEDYDVIPLRLEAGAGFPQHLAFLQAVHRAFPSITVTALDLQSQTRAEAPRPRAVYALAWFTAADATPVADAQAGR